MIKDKSYLIEFLKTIVLLAVSFFTFMPAYLMLIISLKDESQFTLHPFAPTWPLHFENYTTAWKYVGPYIGQSITVAATATFLVILLGSLCAFYFARFTFCGKKFSYNYIIMVMMVPGILNLIPLYIIVTQVDQLLGNISQAINSGLNISYINLRFFNTPWALILPAAAGGQIMTILVLRQFFEEQPAALFEAAKVDGANNLQLYWHIALPLAKPLIGTMAIMNIVALWNDYIWPLVVLQQDHYTVAVGLKFLEGQNYVAYGPLMAGYVMSAVPLLLVFLIGMKLFIEGLSSGAIKM